MNKNVKAMNAALIFAICISCIVVLIVSMNSRGMFQKLLEQQNRFVQATTDARMLQDGSDFLTRKTWEYAQSGNPAAMDAYFDEVRSQRREKAVADYDTHAAYQEPLLQAKALSDKLMELEYHIMRLAAEGVALDAAAMPDEIRSYVLPQNERSLSAAEKSALARDYCFSEEYLSQKNQIDSLIQTVTAQILNDIAAELDLQNSSLNQHLIFQIILVLFLLIIVVSVFLMLYNQGRLLRIQAERDPLTDLMNRRGFNACYDQTVNRKTPVKSGLVLLDVDKFKSVNDTWGHDAGDQVLKELALQLKLHFRRSDAVARLGGDEFAVLLIDLGEENLRHIAGKIQSINEHMLKGEKDVPPCSISAGITMLKDAEPFSTAYIRADSALYESKEQGGKVCSFC